MPGDGGGSFRILREQFQEGFDALGIKAEVRRKLPQNRSKLAAEAEYSRRQEIGERDLHLIQPQHVGDVARPFDGEDEVIGSFRGPAFEVRRSLQGIESAVDFDRAKGFGSVREFAFLRQIVRIEDPAPRLVAPTGDSYLDAAGYG